MAGRSKTRKEIASKLKDDTLDMSYCELDEAPVRQIACIPKIRNLNLSNNNLTSLPNTFANLQQVITLDLSRNKLYELPENFGLMTQLKHLDLYGNQISRLPLSLGDLKNLKWLDLKGNPLTEAVATVTGPCNNAEDCQVCARNVVHYLSTAKSIIKEERLRRLYNLTEETDKQQTMTTAKKEGKKKKKKNIVKECKADDNTADSVVQPCDCAAALLLQHDNSGTKATVASPSTDASARIKESHKSRGIRYSFFWLPKWFYLVVTITIILLLMFHITFTSIIVFEHCSAVSQLKSSLEDYHTHTKDLLENMIDITRMQINSITDVINDLIRMYFKGDT